MLSWIEPLLSTGLEYCIFSLIYSQEYVTGTVKLRGLKGPLEMSSIYLSAEGNSNENN